MQCLLPTIRSARDAPAPEAPVSETAEDAAEEAPGARERLRRGVRHGFRQRVGLVWGTWWRESWWFWNRKVLKPQYENEKFTTEFQVTKIDEHIMTPVIPRSGLVFHSRWRSSRRQFQESCRSCRASSRERWRNFQGVQRYDLVWRCIKQQAPSYAGVTTCHTSKLLYDLYNLYMIHLKHVGFRMLITR